IAGAVTIRDGSGRVTGRAQPQSVTGTAAQLDRLRLVQAPGFLFGILFLARLVFAFISARAGAPGALIEQLAHSARTRTAAARRAAGGQGSKKQCNTATPQSLNGHVSSTRRGCQSHCYTKVGPIARARPCRDGVATGVCVFSCGFAPFFGRWGNRLNGQPVIHSRGPDRLRSTAGVSSAGFRTPPSASACAAGFPS